MTKTKKIAYWVATLWLALGMVSSGIVQFIHFKEEVDMFNRLGYPLYFLKLLAVWKFLGVVAVLVPRFQLVKEWAYAGFFFAMSGALFSHIAVDDPFSESFGPALLLVLTLASWYLRPDERKIIPSGTN